MPSSEPTGLFYEYYLKDHLGNVRQVLRNSTANFRIATMEQANAEEEESTFTQIKPTRKREPKHNVTQGGINISFARFHVPIKIRSQTHEMIESRMSYIHDNPVRAGWVENAEEYLYSSARNYSGLKGLIEVDYW
jgi:hypothetical protein